MHPRVAAINQTDKPDRRKTFPSSPKSVPLKDEDIIREEMKVYGRKKAEFLAKYEGRYIAMLNGEVVDTDLDFSNLATRVYEKFGYRAVFITLVTKIEKPYKISSPRYI